MTGPIADPQHESAPSAVAAAGSAAQAALSPLWVRLLVFAVLAILGLAAIRVVDRYASTPLENAEQTQPTSPPADYPT